MPCSRFDATATGFVLEVEEEWEQDGESWYRRELATGLGGCQRRMGGADERARVAVRKAIASSIARIERHDPGVARLLRDRIRTGTSCRYDPSPDHPVNWITK